MQMSESLPFRFPISVSCFFKIWMIFPLSWGSKFRLYKWGLFFFSLFNCCMALSPKKQNRGWCPKFAPGLNIKIGIVQKVYEWSNCPFAKMILQWIFMGGSFWQKDSLITHILFEQCLFWYLAQVQILGITLYVPKYSRKTYNASI